MILAKNISVHSQILTMSSLPAADNKTVRPTHFWLPSFQAAPWIRPFRPIGDRSKICKFTRAAIRARVVRQDWRWCVMLGRLTNRLQNWGILRLSWIRRLILVCLWSLIQWQNKIEASRISRSFARFKLKICCLWALAAIYKRIRIQRISLSQINSDLGVRHSGVR